MALTGEQIKQVKEQLFSQLEKFPEDQRESIKKQIESMNSEELEDFLEKNKLIKKGEGGEIEQVGGGDGGGGCIFCSISKGEAQSYKIDENKTAVAVLDINPVSKGHSMIVPKEHETIEKLPASVLNLARKVAKKIKSKLKAEDVRIETASVQGHGIVNLIPLYKDSKLEKKQAKPEELIALQKKLQKQTRAKREKKVKASPEKVKSLPEAPRRIP